MSDPQAPTLVEVTAVPQPPAPAAAVKTPPAPLSGAVPGVPLAVAVANALGGTVAGALALGGPVTLAVAGAAAGAAAIGGLARRARTARRSTPQTTLRRTAAAQRAAAPGGLFNPPPPRRPLAGSNSVPLGARSAVAGVRPSGRGTAPVAAAGHRSAGPTSSSASRKGPAAMAMGRTAGTPSTTARRTPPGASGDGPALGKQRAATGRSGSSTDAAPRRVASGAAHTLAKAAGRRIGGAGHASGAASVSAGSATRRDARLAKVAERTARRVAKGQAKAERAAGIDPATGAGTAVSRGGAGTLAAGGVSPVQAKALRRSAMRHRTRMAGVAAATGLVGLASAAAFNWRHKGRVAGHMRRVWTRMAGRARAVRDARDAAIRGTTGPGATGPAGGPAGQLPDVPVPAQHVNVPGRPTPAPAAVGDTTWSIFGRPSSPDRTPPTAPITLGKSTVKETTPVSDAQLGGTAATFSLSSAADVLLQAATTFDPETMIEFLALADDLPVAFGTIQDVLRVLAEKGAEQLPLDPVVAEEIAEGYRAMGKVVQSLEEVGQTFRRAHAEDLERHENPRNGLEAERKWNV